MKDGWQLLEEGRFQEAKAAFTAAIVEGDDPDAARYGRALAYAGLGRRNRAARDLASALEADPDRLDEARGAPTLAAVLRDPHLVAALDPDGDTPCGQAVAALGEGDADAMLEALEPWLETHPDDAVALYFASTARAGKGDAEGSVALARAALALDPGLIDARFNLGAMLAQLGDAAGAEATWREALAREPDHYGVTMNLLLQLRQQERHAESAEVARAYLDEQPRDTMIRYKRAESLALAGQPDAAFEELVTVVSIDPHASDAIGSNPHFAPWVDEPRWAALIACEHLV